MQGNALKLPSTNDTLRKIKMGEVGHLLATTDPLFHGDGVSLRVFLGRERRVGYYTYLLLYPNGIPFYVGKGTGTRVFHHELEALRQSNLRKSNPFKCNTIRKIIGGGETVHYRIDQWFAKADQMACLEREAALIDRYKRRCDGGTLTNLAAGLGSLALPDPFSTQRHASTLSGLPSDNPERAALNRYLRTFGQVDSVPIKPLSQYRPRLVPAQPSTKALKNISLRNCLTLIASATAAGVILQPGVIIPRSFTLVPDSDDWPEEIAWPESVTGVIENGAASDILKLGLVSLVPAKEPENEGLRMDVAQIAKLIGAVGRPMLERWELI